MAQAQRIYIFAGGGTGGHLYPGLAVAQELVRLEPEAKIVFACSSRAIDARILEPTPYSIVIQPVLPLPAKPSAAWPFIKGWIMSLAQARDMIRDLAPSAVLGLGGFAAGPVVRQAARAGVPTALLNPDAVPGKANQYLARRVRAIFTQFAQTTAHFRPNLQSKVRAVGCPIRTEIVNGSREDALKLFDLRGDRKTLLVLGGSLGAASINAAIAALATDLGALADRWQLLHVTGPAGTADAAPAGPPVPEGLTVRRLEYCNRMDLAYAAADLAICRSGAVTVAELAATGTPAILMPYPFHKDQQQKLNASALAAAGAAIVCEDAKDAQSNAQALRKSLLPLMQDPSALDRMRQSARQSGKSDAAGQVARWLTKPD